MTKRHTELVQEWLKTNPPGLEDRLSMHEMIEETWREAIKAGKPPCLRDLFAKVAENWSKGERPYSANKFRAELQSRTEKMDGNAPASKPLESIFYSDEPVRGKRQITLAKIAKAFDIEKDQELKLCRMGAQDNLDLEYVEDLAEQCALAEGDKKIEIRTELMRYLYSNSGIRMERLAEIIGKNPGTLHNWIHGLHRLEDIKGAEKLLKVLLPNILRFPNAEIKRVRTALLSALTDRPLHLNFEDLIAKTKHATEPHKVLYSYLFGAKSVMGMTLSEGAKKLKETPKWLTDRSNGLTATNEDEANRIIELAEKKLGNATAEQKEDLIDALTNIENPSKLMQKVKAGKMSLAIAAVKIRMRKGKSQHELQTSDMSREVIQAVETREEKISPEKAVIYANILFTGTYANTPEREYFISRATDYDALSREEIVARLNSKSIDPETAAAHLLALNGLTRTAFMERAGLYLQALSFCATYSAGEKTIRALADATGCAFEEIQILSQNNKKRKNRISRSSSTASNDGTLPKKTGYAVYPPSVD